MSIKWVLGEKNCTILYNAKNIKVLNLFILQQLFMILMYLLPFYNEFT